MPEFIYFVEPKRKTFPGDGTPEEFAVIGEHMDFLKAKLAAGELILVGRTQDEFPIGITVFEAADQEAADRFAQEDPAVTKGIFNATCRPYSVFLMRGRDDKP
jgi:uncharacterized protein YciI